MICDICSKPTDRKQGYILSTSQVVYDPGYWKRAFTLRPATAEQVERALPGLIRQMSSSESDWIVCEECMATLKADRSRPARDFQDYVKSGKRPSLPETGPADPNRAALVASGAFEAMFGRRPATVVEAEPFQERVVSSEDFSRLMAKLLPSGDRDILEQMAGNLRIRCDACGATVAVLETQVTESGMDCPRCGKPWFLIKHK